MRDHLRQGPINPSKAPIRSSRGSWDSEPTTSVRLGHPSAGAAGYMGAVPDLGVITSSEISHRPASVQTPRDPSKVSRHRPRLVLVVWGVNHQRFRALSGHSTGVFPALKSILAAAPRPSRTPPALRTRAGICCVIGVRRTALLSPGCKHSHKWAQIGQPDRPGVISTFSLDRWAHLCAPEPVRHRARNSVVPGPTHTPYRPPMAAACIASRIEGSGADVMLQPNRQVCEPARPWLRGRGRHRKPPTPSLPPP